MQQIQWSNYILRVGSVRAQFALARSALTSLSTNSEALRASVASEVDPNLGGALRKILPPEVLAAELQKFHLRHDQNELILTIALFETFMKDLHRNILRQTPTLLREERQIPLQRLLAQGADAVIAEEIEREITTLDRKRVRERAQYFSERLGVPWGPPELVEYAERAVTIRNRILHEEPDDPVPSDVLRSTTIVAISVPGIVCHTTSRYPSAFAVEDITTLTQMFGILKPQ